MIWLINNIYNSLQRSIFMQFAVINYANLGIFPLDIGSGYDDITL